MRISVKARPSSKKDTVEEQEDWSIVVRVKAPAKEGKANVAVVRLLSKHLKRGCMDSLRVRKSCQDYGILLISYY